MTKRKTPSRPAELAQDALDKAVGGIGTAREATHVVQQTATAQFNPKEIALDKSVPWKQLGK